jgi:hypothetical protein
MGWGSAERITSSPGSCTVLRVSSSGIARATTIATTVQASRTGLAAWRECVDMAMPQPTSA